MDSIWRVLKADLLEVVRLLTIVFAHSEVEKLVPHSELFLV